jgi:5'-nucleotidase
MKSPLTKVLPAAITRREFLAGSAAGATLYFAGCGPATQSGKKTFTILHTNDLHSNLIGLGPASDYTTGTLNDDKTRGGFARLATVIAQRKAERNQGPVLILDAGDYSMGTAFGHRPYRCRIAAPVANGLRRDHVRQP